MEKTTISFRFRASSRKKTNGVIYGRVTRNGVRSTDFSIGIDTTKPKWVNRKNNSLHEKLEKVRGELLEAARKAKGDISQVKTIWKKASEPLTFQKLGKMLLDERGQDPTIKFQTWRGNKTCYLLLANYDSLTLAKDVSEKWADGLVKWMQCNKYQPSYINKVLQFTKKTIAYGYYQNLLPSDTLERYSFSVPTKPVVYVTNEELALLEQAHFASDALNKVKDLFLFQAYTGLTYTDLKGKNWRDVEQGKSKQCSMAGSRDKTGTAYFIPMEKAALLILCDYSDGLPVYCNAYYNRILKEIALILGIEKRLTTHVARKTAGMRWLDMGYSIESVSLMLGHKSVKTTQNWYARVMPTRVLRETEEINRRLRLSA